MTPLSREVNVVWMDALNTHIPTVNIDHSFVRPHTAQATPNKKSASVKSKPLIRPWQNDILSQRISEIDGELALVLAEGGNQKNSRKSVSNKQKIDDELDKLTLESINNSIHKAAKKSITEDLERDRARKLYEKTLAFRPRSETAGLLSGERHHADLESLRLEKPSRRSVSAKTSKTPSSDRKPRSASVKQRPTHSASSVIVPSFLISRTTTSSADIKKPETTSNDQPKANDDDIRVEVDDFINTGHGNKPKSFNVHSALSSTRLGQRKPWRPASAELYPKEVKFHQNQAMLTIKPPEWVNMKINDHRGKARFRPRIYETKDPQTEKQKLEERRQRLVKEARWARRKYDQTSLDHALAQRTANEEMKRVKKENQLADVAKRQQDQLNKIKARNLRNHQLKQQRLHIPSYMSELNSVPRDITNDIMLKEVHDKSAPRKVKNQPKLFEESDVVNKPGISHEDLRNSHNDSFPMRGAATNSRTTYTNSVPIQLATPPVLSSSIDKLNVNDYAKMLKSEISTAVYREIQQEHSQQSSFSDFMGEEQLDKALDKLIISLESGGKSSTPSAPAPLLEHDHHHFHYHYDKKPSATERHVKGISTEKSKEENDAQEAVISYIKSNYETISKRLAAIQNSSNN